MSLPRPLLWISLAFLLGIALATAVSLPVSVWALLAIIALFIGLLWRFLTHSLDLTSLAADITTATVVLVVFLLGAVRYQSAIPTYDAFDLAWYNDRDYDVLITGWVTKPPDLRDHYANLRVDATGLDTGDGIDLEVDGLFLARVDPNETYQYGDIVRLRGRLKTPPEDEEFSYRDYLARKGIYSYMASAEVTFLPGREGNRFSSSLYALKGHALNTVYRLFPDPEASLLAGILLGVDNGLPDNLQQAFKDTGTAHIIAISGFNIAILAAFFTLIFGRVFGQRRGAILTVAGIGFYTLLVGAEPAVIRAAIMGLLTIFALQVGRRQDGVIGLFATGLVMTIISPFYLQDVSFQLSFAATLGIILYSRPLEQFSLRLLTKYAPHNTISTSSVEKLAAGINNFLLLTLAAQVTTLPIMAYHFNRLSLVSFAANPFILPAQPAVMVLGGLAVLLGMLIQPLGQLAAFITWPFVSYTIHVVEFFAGLPGAAVSVDFPAWGIFVWYAVLLGLTVGRVPLGEWFQRLRLNPPKAPAWGILAALTILAVLIWRAALAIPDGKLHITFLDVGSSDAILIQTPTGGTVLVNGGESLSQLSSQLGQRLPLFHRKLDWLVIASTQENQVASLPRLMDRYPPERVLWSGNKEASFSARTLDAWLTDHSAPVTFAEAGQTLDLGDGATLTVLTSSPRGAVLLVEYKGFRALLPIGLSFDEQSQIQIGKTRGPFTLLLLADAGLAQLNPPEWIQYTDPQTIILSVAADDMDGLPDAETLDAVEGLPLLRTDMNGWIRISTDGQSLWVEVEHNAIEPTATTFITETPPPPIAPTEPTAATEPPFGTEPPGVPKPP